MKKIIISILIVAICLLTGCGKSTKISSTEKTEPTEEGETIAITTEDAIPELRIKYATENVYRDYLNPLSYWAITDDKIITILYLSDLTQTTEINKDKITSVESVSSLIYTKITVSTMDFSEHSLCVDSGADEIISEIN